MAANATTPQDDADSIRLKRLAKLQNSAPPPGETSSSPPPPSIGKAATTPVAKTPAVASPALGQTSPQQPPDVGSARAFGPHKIRPLAKFDPESWEDEAMTGILKVTLTWEPAESSSFDLVWLKHLAQEFVSEGGIPSLLSCGMADRLLIARLEIDPQNMTDDLDYLPVLASLPPQQTTFQFLVGAWKRLNTTRLSLLKKGYAPSETQKALDRLDKVRELLISYAGLSLQEPEMFQQPSGRPVGASELVEPLLSLSAFSTPLLATNANAPADILGPGDVEPFLQDIAKRFDQDGELLGVLGPVVRELCFHKSLSSREGLAGGDAGWRGVVTGLEALVSVKSIAVMITEMEEWIPDVSAVDFEHKALLGPLGRLGVFSREWPQITYTYFSDPERKTKDDLDSSFASLRGTMKSLQTSLFQIFNTLVRASPKSRESVLEFFAMIVSLNVKRAGMQVDPDSVSSDCFMINMGSILLRFAEPFMDANYTKMDKIDPLYYVNSDRIDLGDETRINATIEESTKWAEENKVNGAPAPNFISNIFYLAIAMSHFGHMATIQTYNNLSRQGDDLQRHLDMISGDGSWMGSPMQSRTEAAIKMIKLEQAKIKMQQFAFEVGLLEPVQVFRCIGFTTFLSTWLIRQADVCKTHPNPPAGLPLPPLVPMAFRALPEYILEDIVDYYYFAIQTSPDKFELAGKQELLTFILTFLSSTWYIKNPFLKSKINDVLFMSIWGYGRERNGVLGNLLNTHPMALKHLMSALMHFYIEVEQTGASSQFYDKFNARRNIFHVLKVVWDNPTHREALNVETKNVDKFVRFVNLMINDVTYLMDESLSELTQIHTIQVEMDDKTSWNAQPVEYRREREATLRSLERHASGYTTLGRSTVELLKIFTAETKAPFMMSEIVNRLAAMLNYNLHALVGPRCQDLKVREPEKLKFNPRALLSDIIQVFLNLSDQSEFTKAVAVDERSYTRELFERAADIALLRGLKSEAEIQVLRRFADRVYQLRESLASEEEELGEVPEEFLDPLMFVVMRDPVQLPSSKMVLDRSTIKSHLLSDSKDPFNRAPLSIEDVIPDPELKARIETFIAERRPKGKRRALGTVDNEHMTCSKQ